MTILVNGGGGGAPLLDEDLNFPTNLNGANAYILITGIDGTSGPVTMLSLSGKWIINMLRIENATNENCTISLTVDGVPKWGATGALGGTSKQLVGTNSTSSASYDPFECTDSLLLTWETDTDTSVNLEYLARPIL